MLRRKQKLTNLIQRNLSSFSSPDGAPGTENLILFSLRRGIRLHNASAFQNGGGPINDVVFSSSGSESKSSSESMQRGRHFLFLASRYKNEKKWLILYSISNWSCIIDTNFTRGWISKAWVDKIKLIMKVLSNNKL